MLALKRGSDYFGNGRLVFRRPETAENELAMMNVISTAAGCQALRQALSRVIDHELGMSDGALEEEFRNVEALDEQLDEELGQVGPATPAEVPVSST